MAGGAGTGPSGNSGGQQNSGLFGNQQNQGGFGGQQSQGGFGGGQQNQGGFGGFGAGVNNFAGSGGGFGGQQGGFGGQQGGFGGGFGGQQGGFGGQQGGFGGFGGGQQGGFGGYNPVPQFQNPYGPTIYNPYSPADQRQFGFQTPFQQQQPNPYQQPFQQQFGNQFGQQQFGNQFGNQFGQQPYQQQFGQRDGFPNQQRLAQYQQQKSAMGNRMNPEQQRMQNIAGIHSQDYYQRQQPGSGGFDPRSDVGTMGMQKPYMPQRQATQQPQFQQQTNTDLLRRLGNPMPGTPEHRLRYPEIGTPEFEQLHGPGANAEAQRPRESGPITTMPISPPPENVAEEYNPAQQMQGQQRQQQQALTQQQMLRDMGVMDFGMGPMGGLLNRPHQGPGPGQFGYGSGTGGAPQMNQQQQQMLRDRVAQSQQTNQPGQQAFNQRLADQSQRLLGQAQQLQREQQLMPRDPFSMTMDMPRRYGTQPVPPPNPYQMYGGLGGLFNMQDAYSQRPAPITQAQSNEANRQLLERYKTGAPAPAQSPLSRFFGMSNLFRNTD
jgi:hypothetical protein